SCYLFFFFFQAEDGIRDRNVTGVQTCALPISDSDGSAEASRVVAVGQERRAIATAAMYPYAKAVHRRVCARPVQYRPRDGVPARSEERRVGKEGRSRWWAEPEREKMNRTMREE